ncbi:DUF1963 domain-containing protein [Desertivirga xinjiangensis]|uniref:DUF1963 domain-containing protein n=1 Tax=Desertivirga xinjiangensis TaxID=539206 RepID=UPI00210A4865|nr:DUF1963 domain-containing protein [Pedobacter xinjiangensis]
MSFLKNLFNRNNRPKSKSEELVALEEVEVASGLLLPRAFADHFANIEKTARKTVTIKASPSQGPLSISQSKFGHYPCISKGFPYPRDKDGRYLYPLAQINFSEVPSFSQE